MSKAFSIGITTVSMTNTTTTTMSEYKFVKLATTENEVDLTTTLGVNCYGVTQESINPSESGKIALCSAGGLSRLKMCSTAYTTKTLDTTSIFIGASANGSGRRLTSTSSVVGAISNGQSWAASDIVTVQLMPARRVIEG